MRISAQVHDCTVSILHLYQLFEAFVSASLQPRHKTIVTISGEIANQHMFMAGLQIIEQKKLSLTPRFEGNVGPHLLHVKELQDSLQSAAQGISEMLQRPSLLVMPVSGVHIDLDQLEDLETSQFTLVSTLKPTLLVVVGICSYSLIHEDPDFLTSSRKIRPPDLCRNTACRAIQNLPIKHSKSGGFSYSIDEIVRV